MADGDSKREALLREAVQQYKRVVHQIHLATVCTQLRNGRLIFSKLNTKM